MALFTVVIDACVLHSGYTRDVLLTAATAKVYAPKWSKDILTEMSDSIVRVRPGVTADQMAGLVAQMNAAFPDAEVDGYQPLVAGLTLPDPKDRHVLAAAIRGQAQQIITWNSKDFPDDALKPFDMQARTPDDFLCDVIDSREEVVCARIAERIKGYKKPPMTPDDYFDALENAKLVKTADMLRDLAELFE